MTLRRFGKGKAKKIREKRQQEGHLTFYLRLTPNEKGTIEAGRRNLTSGFGRQVMPVGRDDSQ